MKYDCIIIEGGGFRTAFTSGVLDAFISANYYPTKAIIGISGGAVAMSYYLSEQYRFCINSLIHLSKDKSFADFKRALGTTGYLDIDYLAEVAAKKVPFKLDKALEKSADLAIRVIATNRSNGKPVYFKPTKKDWIQMVIASCTLPFATKGVHTYNGKTYFDGGWSDPLPARWAVSQGYKKILVVRTKPKEIREKQSWADYFGSKYFNSTPALAHVFESNFTTYNESVEFMENPPKGIKIKQIAPKNYLKSGTYSYSKKSLMLDYRYGVDMGLFHLNNK